MVYKTLSKLSVLLIRDGPNTTTTIILQKSFASDATPKRHLMAHQMKNLCGFSVFHCVEGAFGVSSGGVPKMKNGAPRDELKNGRGRGWAVPYLRELEVQRRIGHDQPRPQIKHRASKRGSRRLSCVVMWRTSLSARNPEKIK